MLFPPCACGWSTDLDAPSASRDNKFIDLEDFPMRQALMGKQLLSAKGAHNLLRRP